MKAIRFLNSDGDVRKTRLELRKRFAEQRFVSVEALFAKHETMAR